MTTRACMFWEVTYAHFTGEERKVILRGPCPAAAAAPEDMLGKQLLRSIPDLLIPKLEKEPGSLCCNKPPG